MTIEASPILPDKKNLVQKIEDRKQLVGTVPKSKSDIPRDTKGYTYFYNPSSGRHELTLAIIPMLGDPDYKQSGPEIKPIDMTSALQLEAMELDRQRRYSSRF